MTLIFDLFCLSHNFFPLLFWELLVSKASCFPTSVISINDVLLRACIFMGPGRKHDVTTFLCHHYYIEPHWSILYYTAHAKYSIQHMQGISVVQNSNGGREMWCNVFYTIHYGGAEFVDIDHMTKLSFLSHPIFTKHNEASGDHLSDNMPLININIVQVRGRILKLQYYEYGYWLKPAIQVLHFGWLLQDCMKFCWCANWPSFVQQKDDSVTNMGVRISDCWTVPQEPD